MRASYPGMKADYQAAYRKIRLWGGVWDAEHQFDDYSDAEDCALLSFDYHDSEFSGWINRQRQSQWCDKFSDRYPDLYYQF